MNPLAQTAWSWLQQELDRWSDAGLEASLWWRDDDATRDCDRLQQLFSLSQRCQVPLAIAAIPSRLHASLVDAVNKHTQVTVLQHGYTHQNHADAGELKLELGGLRDIQTISSDLHLGFEQLDDQFGVQFCPVLVPPWNRIDESVLPRLREVGLHGISTYRVCKQQPTDGTILQVNTHMDPVHWRHNQGFIGVYPAIAILIQHLLARRTGYRDIAEPTGVLSHHLVYNHACWQFTEDLFHFLNAHPATRWLDAHQIWASVIAR